MSESLIARFQNSVYMRRYNNRNMSQAEKNKLRIKQLVLGIIVVAILIVFSNSKVQGILDAMKAPVLPKLQTVDHDGKPLPQYWLNQNWGGTSNKVSEKTKKYHHLSQGTATLPIPYDWFIHLEKPDSSLWSTLSKALFSIASDPFSDNNYLLRFGFIRSTADPEFNPDGLPIGFTKTSSMNIPGYPLKTDSIGFTCAACHTGHFIHGKEGEAKEYVIEGAPATTDIGQLSVALGAALGQTEISSKLPFFDGRFDRFARKILGTQFNAVGKAALAENLTTVLKALVKGADIVEVQEGFTRLDALNRIGNQVFSKNVNRPENYQPINAPVNYPFIWTSSWFKWVQYDASIMRPLVRNAGEAMGVTAQVSMSSPKNEHKFESSILIENIVWIEEFLKGKALNKGLTGPAWPFAKVKSTDASYLQGKALYEIKCQSCHLPVMGDPKLDEFLIPIEYMFNGKLEYTADKTLDLNIIPISQIGTDPAQSNVLVTRTVNTAGNAQGTIEQQTKGLGVNKKICGQNTNQVYKNTLFGEKGSVALIDGVSITDGGDLSFGLALGAIVQQTIDAWVTTNGVSDNELKEKFYGGRPNCLQVGQGYKARPLNGVWATAPFLHNGSVATIKDLICKAQEDRPAYIQLGDIRFDELNVGLQQPAGFEKTAQRHLENKELYTREGYFILDTSILGNYNQGHSFSDEYDTNKHYSEQKKGVIGSKINAEQCDALLNYLKTI